MILKNRKNIAEDLKWDLTRIYSSEEDYLKDVEKLILLSKDFKDEYKGKIRNSKSLLKAIEDYEEIMIILNHTSNYSSLDYSVDLTNEKAKIRIQKFEQANREVLTNINFFENEILGLSEELLKEAIDNTTKYKMYIEKIKRQKPHILSNEKEEIISMLRPSIEAPYKIYEDSKLSDMTFEDFYVDGKKYENSFVTYENLYCYDENTNLRRNSYYSFSRGLEKYKNTFAAIYITHITTEKQIATLRGFDSVIDYLLFEQNIQREQYDNHIDIFMEKLAPVMRKYVKLIKKFYKLDKITYADLKLPIDVNFTPKITVEESKKYVEKALKVMGEEYLKVAKSAYSDRWIDFANNIGKSTGGFCSSPYKKGSYILLSFTEILSEVFTLVHEIGHGVHFHLAQKNNSILEEEPSLYFIEAPSTINEILLSNALLEEAKDDRFKRFVYSSQIANTYYHNCVTHFLEAAYQREVYRLVDKKEAITEKVLSEIKLNVIKKFWGDEVEIDEMAGLTWMRQPHYYMGLYSYTYSAGVSIATGVSNRIREDNNYAKKWIEVLSKGGSMNVVDLVKKVDIDIRKTDFLEDTINYISSIVDNIEKLM